MKFNLIFAAAVLLTSFNTFAVVSPEEKQERVAELEKLAKKVPAISVESYKRELEYENKSLNFDDRAFNEARLVAVQIKKGLRQEFQSRLKKMSAEQAYTQILNAIYSDLQAAAPQLKNLLADFAVKTLNEISTGTVNENEINTADLNSIIPIFKAASIERSRFLNDELFTESFKAETAVTKNTDTANARSATEPKDLYHYNTRDELAAAIVSEQKGASWITTSANRVSSERTTKSEGSISVKLKLEFRGIAIDAGPVVRFNKELSSVVTVMAQGAYPVFLDDGFFDFSQRDRSGNVVINNGKPVRRNMNFSCNAVYSFQLDDAFTGSVKGGAGVPLGPVSVGIDVSTDYTKTNSNRRVVEIISRWTPVPETIGKGGTTAVRMQTLEQVCLNNFMNAKVHRGMSIRQSLNSSFERLAMGLTYVNQKTKCVVDSDCNEWFAGRLYTYKNVARCILNEPDHQFATCELRGEVDQNCRVNDANGNRISSAFVEFTCDAGLYCRRVDTGWFSGGLFGSILPQTKGYCTR